MRKIVAALLLAVFIMSWVVVAADSSQPAMEKKEKPPRMIAIETRTISTWVHTCVAYDSQTGVMYLISRGGGICPMLDADGNVLLYSPEKEGV